MKRMLAMLLAVLMVFGMLPAQAFATETVPEETEALVTEATEPTVVETEAETEKEAEAETVEETEAETAAAEEATEAATEEPTEATEETVADVADETTVETVAETVTEETVIVTDEAASEAAAEEEIPAPVLTYRVLQETEEGWTLENWDNTANGGLYGEDELTFAPGEYWLVFYLNTWNSETGTWDYAPVHVEFGEYLTGELLVEGDYAFLSDAEDTGYYYHVVVSESDGEQTTSIAYENEGIEVTVRIECSDVDTNENTALVEAPESLAVVGKTIEEFVRDEALNATTRRAVTNTKNITGQEIVNEARKWESTTAFYWSGTEPWLSSIYWRTGYTYNGQTSFDCSGFVGRVLNDCGLRGTSYTPSYGNCVLLEKYGTGYIGISIEELVKYGTDITTEVQEAKSGDYDGLYPGDLIGWTNNGRHIIIYAGKVNGKPWMVEWTGSGFYYREVTAKYQSLFESGARLVPYCSHPSYKDNGICTKCGQKFNGTLDTSTAGVYSVVKDFTPRLGGPYDADTKDTSKTFSAGSKVTVFGSLKNAYGNLWYQIGYGDGKVGYVFHEYLKEYSDPLTVTYNANGGSGAPGNQTKVYGSTLTLSSTKPTRSGYTFLGWSTSSTATSATYAAGGSYTVNASATLYAVWKKIPTYTITLNPNGGTCSTTSITVTQGKAIGKLPVPTRSGYIFEGWYTSGGTQITADSTFTANTTIYAVWNTDYVDLGDQFYAYIGNKSSGLGVCNVNENVQLGTANVNASTWLFLRQSDGSYEIRSAVDLLSLDVYNNETENGTNVQVYPNNGTLAQRWFIRAVDGGYVIIAANSGKALDIQDGNLKTGTNLQLYTINNTAAQIMTITKVMPTISCSTYSLSVKVGESKTIDLTKNGNYAGSVYFNRVLSNSNVSTSWGSWNGDTCPITITGVTAGTTVMTVSLRDSDTDKTLGTIQISITVTTDDYVVTFDPNNGDSVITKTVKPGESLTAPPAISTKPGYTFLGWGFSDGAVQLPPGAEFTPLSNLNFYAVWQWTGGIMYGDVNYDNKVNSADVIIYRQYLEAGTLPEHYGDQAFMLRADLNRNGKIDETDLEYLRSLTVDTFTQEDMHGAYSGISVTSYPKTTYTVGEKLDINGLEITLVYGAQKYKITEDLTVTGFDPNKVGKQTLTVKYHQFTTTYSVTVQAAHQHSYNSTVVKPTCTAKGYTQYTCSCGDTYKDNYVNALGHTEVTVKGKAATCTKAGKTDGKKCSVCGTVTVAQKTIKAKGHTYTDDQDATCNVCGAEREIAAKSVPMYRMYDPNSGEHFYTGSTVERDFLMKAGWSYEGVGFNFPKEGKPVYRLYEPVHGEHLYTMDEAERAKLISWGWNDEGVAFNSAGEDEVPQYRLHNPNAKRGGYHFTGSVDERNQLISIGWINEGIGWYSCAK